MGNRKLLTPLTPTQACRFPTRRQMPMAIPRCIHTGACGVRLPDSAETIACIVGASCLITPDAMICEQNPQSARRIISRASRYSLISAPLREFSASKQNLQSSRQTGTKSTSDRHFDAVSIISPNYQVCLELCRFCFEAEKFSERSRNQRDICSPGKLFRSHFGGSAHIIIA